MERALRRPVDLPLLFDGCPQPVLEALAVQNVRVEIGRRLTRALGEFTLDSGGIPPDSWGPPQGHPLPRVSAEPYEGIPTGLAISGVLLNVVFLEPDRVIGDYLERTLGEGRGAIVRFADDMYVLSRSSDGLLSLVEAVHGALSGAEAASLAMANGVSNICINFGKIKPDAVQDVIGKYLLKNGWTPCEKCKQPLPTIPQEFPTAGVLDWWAANSSGDEFSSHREALQRAAIEQGDVGPFVTSLVERLSDMGTEHPAPAVRRGRPGSPRAAARTGALRHRGRAGPTGHASHVFRQPACSRLVARGAGGRRAAPEVAPDPRDDRFRARPYAMEVRALASGGPRGGATPASRSEKRGEFRPRGVKVAGQPAPSNRMRGGPARLGGRG